MSDDLFFNNQDSKYSLKKESGENWIESSFGKYAWFNNQNTDGSFVGKTTSSLKFNIFKLTILFIMIILASKSFYLQIAKGAEYKDQAETNRIRIVPIIAERGIIYDRNQKRLVYNIPDFFLAIIPKDLPKDDNDRMDMMERVSHIINVPAKDIEERLSLYSPFNYQSVPIKTNLEYNEALELEILNNTYPSIQIETGIKREYEATDSMSHVLGFLRKVNQEDLNTNKTYLPTDDIGKAGIEAEYEKVLRGTYGKKQLEVDALGRPTTILAKEDPIPGQDITLTIDNDLQKKAEEVLSKHLRVHGLKRGSVIISDPNNGEILAMVSLPAYDNNLFSGGLSLEDYSNLINDINKPLFNRSIAGAYPSGSTIKMVFAAAALEEGNITENTTFQSTGGIQVGEWFFPDWKVGGHGTTNVRKALAESVNTFFYIIGGGILNQNLDRFTIDGLGVAKLTKYAAKFGLGKKLGIDIPGEVSGFLPSKEWKEETKKEAWYIGDTYHLAIGQGDMLVTPLQVNYWTSVFANKGTLYKPHILKTVTKQDGSINVTQPEILNKNFITKNNIDIVRSGLRDGVLYGSSRSLLDLNVTTAGKTGTAEWHTNKKPHAWWTGFAPYENPQIVITVLVEDGGEGSSVALPIAKELIRSYFNN